MRHLPLVAVAILLGSGALKAQSGPQFGVTAGLNISNLTGEQSGEKRSAHYDFMAGGTMIYPFSDMMAVQAELLYSRQGAKSSDASGEATLKLAYLTVPVLLRFELGDAKSQNRPALYVGPYVAAKVGCSLDAKSGAFVVSGDCSSSSIDVPVKSLDYGATAGGELAVGPVGIFARYSMGFVSVDDSKSNQLDEKNRVITIGARFSFGSK